MTDPMNILLENVGYVEYCLGKSMAWDSGFGVLICGSANNLCDLGKLPSLNLFSQLSREHNSLTFLTFTKVIWDDACQVFRVWLAHSRCAINENYHHHYPFLCLHLRSLDLPFLVSTMQRAIQELFIYLYGKMYKKVLATQFVMFTTFLPSSCYETLPIFLIRTTYNIG